MSMNKPSHREHASVREWLDNAKPIAPAEQDFIHRREDLVTLRPGREHAFLDSFIELVIRRLRWKPVTVRLHLPFFRPTSLTRIASGCSDQK